MIVVIKAPEKATLVLPDTKHPREIYLKSDNGEINVFLCPDANAGDKGGSMGSSTGCGNGGGGGSNENTVPNSPVKDTLLDDIDSFVTPIYEKYLSPRLKATHSFTHPVGSAQRNLSKALSEQQQQQQLPSSNATASASTSSTSSSSVFTSNELDLLGHHNRSSTSSSSSSSSSNSSSNSGDEFLTSSRGRTLNISPLSPFAKRNNIAIQQQQQANNSSNSSSSGAVNAGQGTAATAANGKNVLMSEAGNFSPLHMAQFDANDDFSRFLSIEPPLETEYNFSLGNSEGVFDLFDFDF